MDGADVRTIIQQAIDEYMRQDTARDESAFQTELGEERRLSLELETRMKEMAEEIKKSRAMAEEAHRVAAIRSELRRPGVSKVDLVFKAVQEHIAVTEDGRLMAGGQPMSEYLREFTEANPEFVAARVAGGTGTVETRKAAQASGGAVDLDRIGPGMSRDELERVREAIMRVGAEMNR